MRISLARPHVLIGMCLLSAAVLLFSSRSASATRISPWGLSAQASASLSDPAPPAIYGKARPVASSTVPSRVSSSVPLGMAGDVGFNIRAALDANSGALRSVTIRPGETWSFNAAVGNPARVEVRTVGGIPGGGWCDLASRYVQAVRSILPASAIHFPNHVASTGIGLSDVDDADTVAIWNIDGQPGSTGGRGDLEITNTLAAPLSFQVVEFASGQLVVRALVDRA
jgi:hypothetical protein